MIIILCLGDIILCEINMIITIIIIPSARVDSRHRQNTADDADAESSSALLDTTIL